MLVLLRMFRNIISKCKSYIHVVNWGIAFNFDQDTDTLDRVDNDILSLLKLTTLAFIAEVSGRVAGLLRSSYE